MPSRRRNYCFAPGCRTGYSRVKDALKASLFNVPRDEERRKQWERNLHRADKVLDATCAVCELHFEQRYIIRDYVHLVDGKEVRIPRGRPLLSEDAVPTILPNLPAYLSKTTPKPRSKRKRLDSDATARKKSRDDLVLDTPEPSSASVDVPSTEAATPTAAGPAETDHRFAFLFLLKTPSKYWSTHYFPELDGVLYCTSVLCDGAVTSEKVVMFVFDQQTDAHCKVYLRGRLAQEHRVMSQAEAENLLEKVDAFNLCVGALNAQEYNSGFLTAGIREKLTLRQGTYFNNNCHGKVTTKGRHHAQHIFFSTCILMTLSE